MRKRLRSWSFFFALAAVGVAPPVQGDEAPPPGPPVARKIPGITVPDAFPNACVDCHLNYVEQKMDVRFGTLMGQWAEAVDPKLLAQAQASAPNGLVLRGKHPAAPGVLTDIPRKCLACHAKGAKNAPAFAAMIHNIHFTGGQENHFLTLFQGECTHCHKIDSATGRSAIPSAPEK